MAPKSKKHTVPQSAFARTTRLFGAAASLAGRELKSRLAERLGQVDSVKKLKSQVEQAQVLVQALSELKGAAMKAGQWLGIGAAEFLPPEVVSVLRKLHDEGHSLPTDQIKKLIRKELGAEKFKQLSEISEQPIGSASIGQVHRAKLGTEDIAIKVQFPGVAKSIESDLRILKRIAESALKLSNRKIDLNGVFKELRQTLLQESDYETEARLLQQYSDYAKSHPAWRIPAVYPEYCSSRILTMSYEPGIRLGEWLKSNPSEEERAYYSKEFLELYFTEFFLWGMVQTDPNYANFLIRPESRQIVLLDFGAIKIYSKDFRKTYVQFIDCSVDGRFEEAYSHAIELGWIDKRENEETKKAFLDMVKQSSNLFATKNVPFDFADERFFKENHELSLRFVNKVRYSAPPHSILFLHRKMAGVFFLLRSLKAKIDLTPYLEIALKTGQNL